MSSEKTFRKRQHKKEHHSSPMQKALTQRPKTLLWMFQATTYHRILELSSQNPAGSWPQKEDKKNTIGGVKRSIALAKIIDIGVSNATLCLPLVGLHGRTVSSLLQRCHQC